MTDSDKAPRNKRANDKHWYKNPSTLISLGAMLIALASAGIGIIQANTAEQQNIAAEQQELVTLVAAIANDSATLAQQSLTFKNNQAELSQAMSGTEFTELTDSEEAVNLIGLLHDNGVTATEYYETALGLEPSDSYAEALSLLMKAVDLPADPRTHASILRAEAEIFYELGRVSEAERSDALAAEAFDHAPDVTKADQDNNVAETKFFDAWFQATISCSTAMAEVNAGKEIIAANAMSDVTASVYTSAKEQLQHEGCMQSQPGTPAPTLPNLGSGA